MDESWLCWLAEDQRSAHKVRIRRARCGGACVRSSSHRALFSRAKQRMMQLCVSPFAVVARCLLP